MKKSHKTFKTFKSLVLFKTFETCKRYIQPIVQNSISICTQNPGLIYSQNTFSPKTGFQIFRFTTNYCCMAWNKENPYFLKVETESDYSAKILRCYFYFIVRRSRLQTIIDFVNLWFNKLYDKVFKVHMLEICFW